MPTPALLQTLKDFYGLSDAFPTHRLAARSAAGRSLVLLSDDTFSILSADPRGQLRVVSAGVRLFDLEVQKGVSCPYRVCHDGLCHLLPHLKRQRANCSAVAAAALLSLGLLQPEEVQRDALLAAGLSCCAAGDCYVIAM